MNQDGTNSGGDRTSVTDSPWLWVAIFICGALIALTLMKPKFQRRQFQLERQYVARQAAGQSVEDRDAALTTQSGDLIVTLRPLFYLLVFIVLALAIVFWSGRIRYYLSKPSNRGSEM